MNAIYKGLGPVSASFAVGGAVLTQRSRFAKDNTVAEKIKAGKPDDAPTTKGELLDSPDVFRRDDERTDYTKKSPGGELAETEGETKKQPTIKPRK